MEDTEEYIRKKKGMKFIRRSVGLLVGCISCTKDSWKKGKKKGKQASGGAKAGSLSTHTTHTRFPLRSQKTPIEKVGGPPTTNTGDKPLFPHHATHTPPVRFRHCPFQLGADSRPAYFAANDVDQARRRRYDYTLFEQVSWVSSPWVVSGLSASSNA